MNTSIFKSTERGKADYGWLKANYSFSFSNYYNPNQIQFGKLRVLNDDTIQGGMGFAKHPHANMEIITIPLSGAIAHEDSTGGKKVIRPGEVQVMSAGTGIEHSEKNAISNGETNLLQIWIFPKEQNISPRYDQQYFEEQQRKNTWQPIVSNLHPGALSINQDAVLSLANLEEGNQLTYTTHYPDHGVYLFVIDGEIRVENEELKKRDALGITDAKEFTIHSKSNAKILSIEVPMI